MDNYIFWGVQIFTTLALSIIAYFLKEIKKSMSEDIAKNEERTGKLEREVYRLPEKYVLKCDYQITIENINRKFDTIDGKLDRIIGNVSKNAN